MPESVGIDVGLAFEGGCGYSESLYLRLYPLSSRLQVGHPGRLALARAFWQLRQLTITAFHF